MWSAQSSWGPSKVHAPPQVRRAGFQPEVDWHAIALSSEAPPLALGAAVGAPPEGVAGRRAQLAAALKSAAPAINWRRIALVAAIVLGALALLGLQISALVFGVGNRAQVDKVLASVTRLGEDLDPDFEAPLNSRLLNPNSGYVGLYRAQPLWKVYREDETCCADDASCARYVAAGSTRIGPDLITLDPKSDMQSPSEPFQALYQALRLYVQGLPEWGECVASNNAAEMQNNAEPWFWSAKVHGTDSVVCQASERLKEMKVAVAQTWDRACARYCETNYPTTRYVGSLASVMTPQCLCLRSCSGLTDAAVLAPTGYRVFERAGPQDAARDMGSV